MYFQSFFSIAASAAAYCWWSDAAGRGRSRDLEGGGVGGGKSAKGSQAGGGRRKGCGVRREGGGSRALEGSNVEG